MKRLALILVAVIAVLFVAGRWLGGNGDTSQTGPQTAAVTTPDNSDYYLEDATVYQFGDNGALTYRAHAAETLHFANDSARLSDIDVHYVKGTKTYWDLHADKGRIPAGQRDIYLYDGVTGQHPRDNGQLVHFTTPHAWVRTERNLVETEAAVKTTQPGQTVSGNGMRIDLDTNTLNLLHDVHVTYSQ